MRKIQENYGPFPALEKIDLKSFLKRITDIFSRNIKCIEQTEKVLKHINKNLLKYNRFYEQNERTIERVASYEKKMDQIARTNECVEETICNILLAIRQNECYKEWIPQAYEEKK